MNRSTRPLALAAAVVFAAAAVVHAQESKKAESEPTPTETLAWMTGTWRTTPPGQLWEETWSTPEGDCLVGMLRWVKDGKATMYELMSVVDGEDGQHLRLRHFDRGLVPWKSEKDGPMKLKAVKVTKSEAVFEDAERSFPQRIRYVREGDLLNISLEGMGDDKGKKQAFQFTLVK